MPVRLLLKSLGIRAANVLGPRLPTRRLRGWFCDAVVPYLMDPAVLPVGLVERRTRHFKSMVLCDPYVYVHRNGYWCGVFFEEEVEAYLINNLKQGDTVIDVGMNVGHVTIPAADLVGAGGKVVAFEPNVALASRVKLLVDRQRLRQITILPFGLGAVDGSFTMRMEPDHAGGATFRDVPADEGYRVEMTCQVRSGDEILENQQFAGRVFLKMDVEGFEIQALEGLQKSLARVDHAIIEVSPGWLGAVGVTRLFNIMTSAGLRAFEIEPSGRLGAALSAADVHDQKNVGFLRVQ